MSGLFQPHGKTRIEVDGPIIRLYVQGPWNKELVTETHKVLLTTLSELNIPLWALMVVAVDSAICGPDALSQIKSAATNEENKFGRVATAWVLNPAVEGSKIMSSIVSSLYTDINSVGVFEEDKSAKLWLLQELAKRGAY